MKLALVSRDGVINEARDNGVAHRTQLQFIPGSVAALAQLSQAGYTVVIVTHQPGISRGLFDLDELEAIHATILSAVEAEQGQVAAIFYCPHDEQDQCYCRPPQTGLLDVVEMEFDCDTRDALYFYHTAEEQTVAKAKQCRAIFCDQNDNTLLSQVKVLLAPRKN